MSAKEKSSPGMLSPYRVLDLTDERGLLCGKILADLGADVLQIEPPAGNSARRIAPFYRDEPSPDHSFFWWSYAANKRSVTLDVTRADGRALLERMVASAHFLIESGRPGEMAALGLGYEDLAAINPALIVVSITPFGQTGPYSSYLASDLVGMGMGGFMYVTGDPDRAPLRVGFPHFYLHGSAAGAAGAMLAHAHRVATGEGQHVDVSCQEAVARALANSLAGYPIEGSIIVRQGAYRQTGAGTFMRITWPCKDGFVNFQFSGGASSGQSVNNFVRWMADEGMADEFLLSLDFKNLGYGTVTMEMMDRIVPPVSRFLLERTKQQLFEGAIERRILLFPVSTLGDILEDPQLEARGFFRTAESSDFGAGLTLLGPFARASATPIRATGSAPRLGQHNAEIYIDELGLARSDLIRLASAGVI
ncbi:MAG: CoA transferase [Betaproteobacteria bacterium]|nr:MAG: CoA transferase [Betaproteobacteria bacterium]